MKPFLTIIIAFLFILSTGCSKKTQQEQYEEATSGLKYKAYKNASKVAILGSTEIYNRNQPDSLVIHPPYAHMLLGYFWSVSGKNSFAFAEADIVEDIGSEHKDSHTKYLAQTLRSITMYQSGWPELGYGEAVRANNVSPDQASKGKYEAAVIYLLVGSVYVKEKNFEKAKFFWGGFAKETGIQWPYQICDAIVDFQAGKIQQGLQKAK